ncbi:hypothetical protein [Streptomyces europaeiscabiei]|uniref:hypothetical protein n=1 Tax=Streptomyces europaeiscabiei TaxID=146819 RepID=UPI0038F72E4E
MTENGSLPQEHFFKDIKWRLMRAGGAQLDNPGGWVAGKYDRRWNSTLAQYQRTKELGGTFVILPHDLWGADGTTSHTFPGDNGDWSSFDAFYDRLLADAKAVGRHVVQVRVPPGATPGRGGLPEGTGLVAALAVVLLVLRAVGGGQVGVVQALVAGRRRRWRWWFRRTRHLQLARPAR